MNRHYAFGDDDQGHNKAQDDSKLVGLDCPKAGRVSHLELRHTMLYLLQDVQEHASMKRQASRSG